MISKAVCFALISKAIIYRKERRVGVGGGELCAPDPFYYIIGTKLHKIIRKIQDHEYLSQI